MELVQEHGPVADSCISCTEHVVLLLHFRFNMLNLSRFYAMS
jgi:hypothetical protein